VSALVARFQGGFGAALQLLLAGRLDVAFGRSEGLGLPFPSTQLARRPVRLEPLALLLPHEHPLAALDAVPLAALRGAQVDASVGNDSAPEWVDLAVGLLAAFGAEPSPRHLHAVGLEETIRHRQQTPGSPAGRRHLRTRRHRRSRASTRQALSDQTGSPSASRGCQSSMTVPSSASSSSS
jgi:hypothetical protein